jgi:hypothetical protein
LADQQTTLGSFKELLLKMWLSDVTTASNRKQPESFQETASQMKTNSRTMEMGKAAQEGEDKGRRPVPLQYLAT